MEVPIGLSNLHRKSQVTSRESWVQLKFVNAAGDDLDDVEGEHFAGLTFSPASLATAARDTDHHYRFDVTGGTEGTGTVQVSFGHDEMADEKSVDPVAITIDPAP